MGTRRGEGQGQSLSEEQKSIIAEVTQTFTPGGGTIRIKLSDKQAAPEKLAKPCGYLGTVSR
jgi:hypothetical protein